MKEKKKARLLLRISINGFALLAVSFLLMPVSALGFLPGILFYAGLLMGTVPQFLLERDRRRFFESHGIRRQRMQKPRCGLMTFWCDPFAKKVDITLAVSLAVMLLVFLITRCRGYICFVLLGLSVFLLCMHCIVNGRNYFHVTHFSSVKRAVLKLRAKQDLQPAEKEASANNPQK